MIYSLSNTTSYSTFYAFFSSFRITLWPMSLANSSTNLFLSTIVTRPRRNTELTKKLKNLMGKLCCAREHSVQFSCSFFTQTAQFNFGCMSPLRLSSHLRRPVQVNLVRVSYCDMQQLLPQSQGRKAALSGAGTVQKTFRY